jgi:RNA polymerase sigma factor (sigma-70 family)
MDGRLFISKMQSGDPTVWDDIMPMLRRVSMGACSNLGVPEAIREDIVQDVALKLFTHWHSYLGGSALSTWIYAIARNRCLDELRKRAVRGECAMAGESESEEMAYDDGHEQMLCVQQMLAELESQEPVRKNSHRTIDVLRYWVEYSPTTEELAAFLQTSSQAAKQRKYSIRKQIEELCLKFCGHRDCALH